MKYFYAITKYNPIYYNKHGGYIRDEWTEVDDIGKTFEQILFTSQDYIDVENKYLKVIKVLLSNYKKVKIYNIGKSKDYIYREPLIQFSDIDKQLYSKIKGGDLVLNNNEVLIFSRLVLRNELSGDIKTKDFKITFGYDYYMYYESDVPLSSEIKSEIERIGLFVKQAPR